MTTEAAAKKDTQKLQRAIVDGLEDVKAQDIQVFDTEHLSPLFERVIVASGTSNRQTKALASSVRDAVREAGFPKPRIEGEDNGEWIIVDCGAAVAHIMQPAIRQYYHLEEIWGDKPVRLKLGAAKPAAVSADSSTPKEKKAEKPVTSLRRADRHPRGRAGGQGREAQGQAGGEKDQPRTGTQDERVGRSPRQEDPGQEDRRTREEGRRQEGARAQERRSAQQMKLLVVAVGQRMPDWAQTAWDDYAKRFPPELKLELRAVKTEPRGSKTLDTLYAAERERIEAAITKGMRIVALDERGTALTTKALAARLQNWQLEGDDVALVIGGPDGLDPAFKAAAHERIRLSDLTLRACCWSSSSTAPGRSTPAIRTIANERPVSLSRVAEPAPCPAAGPAGRAA